VWCIILKSELYVVLLMFMLRFCCILTLKKVKGKLCECLSIVFIVCHIAVFKEANFAVHSGPFLCFWLYYHLFLEWVAGQWVDCVIQENHVLSHKVIWGSICMWKELPVKLFYFLILHSCWKWHPTSSIFHTNVTNSVTH